MKTILFQSLFLLYWWILSVNSSYPLYCSKDLEANEVTPFVLSPEEEAQIGKLTLKQVQIIIRHGARTPATARKCWNGYNETWNCNVRENIIPGIVQNGSIVFSNQFIFEKQYEFGEEELPGNCELGQLLELGYFQELSNGRKFRKAYLENLDYPLFETTDIGSLDLSDSNEFYFEGSDIQRTRTSGELLVTAMFAKNSSNYTKLPTIATWHFSDFSMSRFYPNLKICPRLENVYTRFTNSKSFQDWNKSHEVQQVYHDMKKYLPGSDPYYIFDCVMTSLCNDRPFPSNLSLDIINKYITFYNLFVTKLYTYNQNEYSKLSIYSLMKDIKKKLHEKTSGNRKSQRFLLYSGHDTTLMPLLASIAGDRWMNGVVPYASYISIELYHSEKNDDFYVRLLFQGKELVLPGCEKVLCPLAEFNRITDFVNDDSYFRCHTADHKPQSQNASDGKVKALFMVCLPVVCALVIGLIAGLLLSRYRYEQLKRNHTRYFQGDKFENIKKKKLPNWNLLKSEIQQV